MTKKLFITGISLIILSLLLLVYYEYEEVYSKKKNNDTMSILLNEEIASTNLDETIVINGLEYAGYLSIPSLELELAITKEYSYSSLKISPSIYYGSIKNNNLVICGHSYKAHFGNLYKLKKGDIVIYTDVLNNQYVYQVELVEELEATNIKEMVESNFDLTLYTCSFDTLKRITVRCNLIYE